MKAICINDRKCRNLLSLGEEYDVEPCSFNKNCFSVKLKNNTKKGATAKNHMNFKRDRFVVVKK